MVFVCMAKLRLGRQNLEYTDAHSHQNRELELVCFPNSCRVSLPRVGLNARECRNK